MNPAAASREICWNIDHPWLIYVLAVPALVIAGYGIYRRLRLWRCGQPELRHDRPLVRLALVLRYAVAQARILTQGYAGTFHLLVSGGFLVMVLATTVVMLDYDFGCHLMQGAFYLWFQSLAVDICGLLVLVGIAMAALRRWVRRPPQLTRSRQASLILVAIAVIVLSGFGVEGLRIAATADPWASWSPVGAGLARASQTMLAPSTIATAHAIAWWFHLLAALALIAAAPYTRLIHLLTGPLNIFFANPDGHGQTLKSIDFEDEDVTLGVNDLADLTWKDLLDLDACTECGRCTAVCPANRAGKPLSPRDIILQLRGLMSSRAGDLLTGGDGSPDECPTARESGAVGG